MLRMWLAPVLVAEHPFHGHFETSYFELGLVTDARGLRGDLAKDVASEDLSCLEWLIARGCLALRVFLGTRIGEASWSGR